MQDGSVCHFGNRQVCISGTVRDIELTLESECSLNCHILSM